MTPRAAPPPGTVRGVAASRMRHGTVALQVTTVLPRSRPPHCVLRSNGAPYGVEAHAHAGAHAHVHVCAGVHVHVHAEVHEHDHAGVHVAVAHVAHEGADDDGVDADDDATCAWHHVPACVSCGVPALQPCARTDWSRTVRPRTTRHALTRTSRTACDSVPVTAPARRGAGFGCKPRYLTGRPPPRTRALLAARKAMAMRSSSPLRSSSSSSS